MLEPYSDVQRLTYKISESVYKLKAPHVLSHWDATNVYLCLPILSCNPKLVRFGLPGVSSLDELDSDTTIQTLASPVFFPSSTPFRRPTLLYNPSRTAEKSDFLVLALDSYRQSEEEGANSYPPIVMEWKIPAKEGWRAWNENIDGEEGGLREQQAKTYECLRGNFIDPERRFNVVVRSGLNWTRKAFLSCA
jgi:hypothetical protein